MKRIVFILLCMTMCLAVAYPQAHNSLFNEIVHDFGEIPEKGGKVTCDFVFTNTTGAPITISKVRASCGCTTPEWTSTPVEAGKTGTVSATYNPSGRPGKFNKTITVTFSDGDNARLSIKGDVIKGETPPETQYPVHLGNLFLKAKEIRFPNAAPGKSVTVTLDAFNNSDTAITPSFAGLPAYISYTPTAIAPKSAGKLTFSIKEKTFKKHGRNTGTITYDGNKINYSIDVIDDFSGWTDSQRVNAGKMNLSTTLLNFNKTNNTATLKISNSGSSTLNIKAIQSDNPDIEISKTSLSIKPDKIAEIKVKYPANKINSNGILDIRIYSDDPAGPMKIVKVRIDTK